MAGTVVKIKQSSVAGKKPVSGDIEQGELALNTSDQKLYSKDGSGNIFEISSSLHFDMGDSLRHVYVDGGDSNDGLYAAPFDSYDGGGA